MPTSKGTARPTSPGTDGASPRGEPSLLGRTATTRHLGLTTALKMSWYLLGLGTTGGQIVRQFLERTRREFGRRPSQINYLLIDGVAASMDEHSGHFISTGNDGAGSNPHVGRRMFFQYYDHIKNAALHHIDRMFRDTDPLLSPSKTPREALSFLVVGSSFGGVSGGMLDPAISLCHDVAQRHQIATPRIHVSTISPQTLLRDATRETTPEQQAMVWNTYAENLNRILGFMAQERDVCEFRPDGSQFSVSASDRVFLLHTAALSNGRINISTIDELVGVIADTLFLYVFTETGHYLEQRICDIFATRRLLTGK